MKAALYYGVGDIRIEDIEKPKVGPGDILMKNMSTLTCGTELKQYRRGYPAFKEGEMRLFGHESSGIVAEVGEGVTKFKVGDRIAAHNTAPCNQCYYCRVGQHSLCENLIFSEGSWAEYRLIQAPIVEQNTFLIPEDISFSSAALLEPLSCAVHGIDEANLHLMDTVAINGAGPLGLMLLVIAKMRGAYVIITDFNTLRLDVAKKLGADITIDLNQTDDQVQAVREASPDRRGVDVAIDATGLPEIWEKNLYMVRRGGTVMEFGGCKGGTTITIDTGLLHYDQITVKGIFHTTPRLVEQAFYLIKRGYIRDDMFIGGLYSLDHCIEALESHGRGKVIKNEIRFEL